jgi:TolA protein
VSTPEQLGKYKIVRVLGKGAMGIVYEGFDPVIERTVAIKTIRVDELDAEEAEEHSRRFKVEAKAAGKLNHPNIVGIYDYGEEQSLAYIVMEYVQGKELKSYLDSGQKFPIKQTVHIMGQLLDALGYSHDRGVIHRDIKPANLFITEQGMVKLGDFGIARIDSTHKTHAGTVLGTPSYMSPEQIKGESVDNRSDLYSCGVILYQFLTGEKPFSGSMVAVMHKVLAEEPPKPSSINPQVTPQLEQVVARAMAKRPEDRYANAGAFIEALRLAAGMDKVDDDAEATRVIKLSEVMSATQAADQTARTAAVEATGLAGRTANQGENDIEIEFWRSIKDSADTDDFDVYLKKYPQGHYAELAQLKLNKLRRSETTQTGTQAAEATATGRTGGTKIEDIRRKAEEARRKAEDEMRRAEEELQRAEAAQFKAEEEARQKAAAAATESAALTEAATAYAARVDAVLASNEIKTTRNEIRDQCGTLLRQAADLLGRLQTILRTPDLLPPEAIEQATQDQGRCSAAETATRKAQQRYEEAYGQLLAELQRNVEIVTQHGHEASQALQETERLAESALQAGISADGVAKVTAATEQLRTITEDARAHIERVLRDRDLLQPEVLKTIQTAQTAYGRAEDKAQETLIKVESALRQAEEEARRKAEEEAKRKAEEEARRKAEEEAKRKAEEEARRKAEEEAKQKAEEEARRKAEEEAKRKAEEEARRKAEEEAKQKAEEEARRKAEEEAKQKAEEEARRKAEEEAKRKAEEETRRKAEEEAKRKAEEEAKHKTAEEAKREAEAEAKRKADEEAKQKAEAEARRKADEEAKQKAEAEARRKADEDAKRKAEAEAKRKADEEAKQKAEAEARRKADEDAKRKAEAEAKRKADEEAKQKAEAEAKRKVDEETKQKTEAEAKRKADEEAKQKAEAEAKRKADEEAKRRAEEAASDETLVVPSGKRLVEPDSDATIMVAAPTPRAPEPPPRPVERPTPAPATEAKKGLPIVPIAIGGVLVAGVVGWLMTRGPSEPEAPVPTPPAIPAPAAPAPSAESRAAQQETQVAEQAAVAARQQAEEQQRKLAEAQKAAEDAKRKMEEAKRLGDTKAAEEARRQAEEETRKAEAQRKAAAEAEAQRKAAEAEAQRKAADEARVRAEAEARRKAEAEAQRKAAAEEEARRKAAEAEAQRKATAEAERRAAAEAEAQRKAAAEAEAQRRATETKPAAGGTPAELFQQAKTLEGEGRYAEAVRLYKQAGNGGHGPSSKRLGEIYLKGAKGVSRDYAESVRWYDKARQQGMEIPN